MSRCVSPAGLALVKKFEGFRAQPMALPEGGYVIGYGHVRAEKGEALSQAEAEALLAADLQSIADFLNAKVERKLSQGQFDALVSFAFSIGLKAFQSSAVLRHVRAGKGLAAACALEAWRKAEIDGEAQVIGALIARRAFEKAMFLKNYQPSAAASALLKPQMDHAHAILGAPGEEKAAPEPVSALVAAPVSAPAPALEAVEASAGTALAVQTAPATEHARRITEILMSEPATAAALTHVPAAEAMEEDEEEIVTAHAKPVARALAKPARKPSRKPWRFNWREPVEAFGLAAFLLFGLGLVVLGAGILLSGRGDLIDIAGASALSLPGAVAMALAGFGLARGPKLAHVSA